MKIITKKEAEENFEEFLKSIEYLKEEDKYEYQRKIENTPTNRLTTNIPKIYQEAWLESCDEKIKEWHLSKKEKKGLYIYGGCGTGKTYSLYALYKNMILNGLSARIINVTDLLRVLKKDSLNKNEDRMFEYYYDFGGVLFIDDIGVEKNTEFVEENLYAIINNRYENGKWTIFSSNLSLKELSEKNGDRLVSRIAGMCDVLELKGEDKRLK